MQQPQLLIYGIEGRLADSLEELAESNRFWLRRVNHLKSCRNLLRSARPGVLVLHIGRDVEKELALLAQVREDFPETAVIVVGDTDNPPLAALAWDLGAHYVLFPAGPFESLAALVIKLLAQEEAQPS